MCISSSVDEFQTLWQEECVPVSCLLSVVHCMGRLCLEALPDRDPWTDTPGQIPPLIETQQTETPWQRPHWTETPGQRPLDRDPFLDRVPLPTPWTKTPWKEHGTRDRDPLDPDPTGQRPPPAQRSPSPLPLDRDTPGRNMRPETETPRRNMGQGSQTGSDIIQRTPPPPRGQNNRNVWKHYLAPNFVCEW